MPGWDKLSYAWHGDDGMFFHASSTRGTPLSCPPGPNTGAGGASSGGGGFTSAGGGGGGGVNSRDKAVKFGAGDVIGCGIAYVANNRLDPRLFFTKNGVLVGVKYHQRLRLAITEPLFPCVGSTTHQTHTLNIYNVVAILTPSYTYPLIRVLNEVCNTLLHSIPQAPTAIV